MKILMISSYLPFPLLSGGSVRLYNLMKELSVHHEITLICEIRPYQKNEDIEEVKKICKEIITVERKKQWSISNIIKSVFSSHSFLITGHTHPELKQRIQETVDSGTFDVIHVETYYVMQNLPANVFAKSNQTEQTQPDKDAQPSPDIPQDVKKSIPVVLVEHNIEYSVYEKFRDRAFSLLRPLLQIDIAKIKQEEETFWKQATAVVAVSHEDQDVMTKVGVKPFLVSNGVNIQKFGYKNIQESLEKEEKKILFMGDFTWIQNRDSATFIIKEIWPLLSEKLKSINVPNGDSKKKFDVKLWIVGRKIPDSIRRLTDDKDVLFDEASSILPTEKIFQRATVLLAPIRVGGGTSYKILESMSCGTPVITMQLSADALGAKDGQNIVIGQTSQELSDKSLQLLQDSNLYKTVSKNGRTLIEAQYTWQEISKKLEDVYKSCVILNS